MDGYPSTDIHPWISTHGNPSKDSQLSGYSWLSGHSQLSGYIAGYPNIDIDNTDYLNIAGSPNIGIDIGGYQHTFGYPD